ncbi:aspartyl-phosphate phosphatase Spo0E family protein [Clostridium grantii]|uniref:Spo0E like sporulation regulatory protein n=1 Tax=Clostridium grantii DSM 8605 TaxID=1121316 RepID=A0A1M5VDN8_9CLOT|nr:aspartyl-phosphate phosphatase Spo0E family protein [Clostridium grantii]SHH73369.1 Spo0E like sporulation regulatory protein [Clostridium grantii DSM 8605]
MEINSTYLEEKREHLNKLIEKNPSNLLTTEIIKASQDLDLLIKEYQLFMNKLSQFNGK